jgi:type I restriction enzyme, S subunit
MNGDLPEGWARASIGDVITDLTYGTAKKCNYEQHGVPVLRIPNVSNGKIDHADLKYAELPATERKNLSVTSGDVLVIRSNGSVSLVGQSAVIRDAEEGFVFAGYLIRLRHSEVIMPELLHYALSGIEIRSQIELEARSTSGVNNINAKEIRALPLSLPPLAEQQRIVAKTDVLFGKVETSRDRLDKILLTIRRFRHAVLDAACSGRLTADLRHGEPSSEELPPGWRWTTVSDLLPLGGIFDGPFGSNLKSSDYTESGIRVIRLENIGHLRFIGEKETYVNRAKYESLKKHTVREGDIVFSSFISEQIRVCVLPPLSTGAIAKADCFCIRPTENLVDRDYLAFQLACKESYDRLREHVHGATRPRVNTTQLRTLSIRICPLIEQKEIVRRVNALFAVADKITARYERARTHVNKLTQSILAKAFRGELVLTEAELARHEGRDFESAAQMLDRVKNVTSKPVASETVKRRAPTGNRSRSKALI